MSEAERARLREVAEAASPRGSSYEAWIDPPTVLALLDALASLAARLAAVEALMADPWVARDQGELARYQEGFVRRGAVSYGEVVKVEDLRAALHSDPSEATT